MTESSFSGDNDLTAGATVEGKGGTTDSATADRAAAFDDPTSSAAGNVTDEDAVVASPRDEDSAVTEDITASDDDTSHAADVDAGYDDQAGSAPA
jgi:hypothetical protein